MKPREFWLDLDVTEDDGTSRDYVYTSRPSIPECYVHVIEKSAYDELNERVLALVKCLEDLKRSCESAMDVDEDEEFIPLDPEAVLENVSEALTKYRESLMK